MKGFLVILCISSIYAASVLDNPSAIVQKYTRSISEAETSVSFSYTVFEIDYGLAATCPDDKKKHKQNKLQNELLLDTISEFGKELSFALDGNGKVKKNRLAPPPVHPEHVQECIFGKSYKDLTGAIECGTSLLDFRKRNRNVGSAIVGNIFGRLMAQKPKDTEPPFLSFFSAPGVKELLDVFQCIDENELQNFPFAGDMADISFLLTMLPNYEAPDCSNYQGFYVDYELLISLECECLPVEELNEKMAENKQILENNPDALFYDIRILEIFRDYQNELEMALNGLLGPGSEIYAAITDGALCSLYEEALFEQESIEAIAKCVAHHGNLAYGISEGLLSIFFKGWASECESMLSDFDKAFDYLTSTCLLNFPVYRANGLPDSFATFGQDTSFTGLFRPFLNAVTTWYSTCFDDSVVQQSVVEELGPSPGFFTDDGSLSEDEFASNKYKNNLEKNWRITFAPGSRIQLDFIKFEVELDFDTVSIFDGPSAGSPLIAELSGYFSLPDSIVSSGNELYIRFQTDAKTRYDGFWIEYSVAPNVATPSPTAEPVSFLYSEVLGPTKTTFTDRMDLIVPNEGSGYVFMRWIILPYFGRHARLKFNRLNLRKSDTITVFEGNQEEDFDLPILATFNKGSGGERNFEYDGVLTVVHSVKLPVPENQLEKGFLALYDANNEPPKDLDNLQCASAGRRKFMCKQMNKRRQRHGLPGCTYFKEKIFNYYSKTFKAIGCENENFCAFPSYLDCNKYSERCMMKFGQCFLRPGPLEGQAAQCYRKTKPRRECDPNTCDWAKFKLPCSTKGLDNPMEEWRCEQTVRYGCQEQNFCNFYKVPYENPNDAIIAAAQKIQCDQDSDCSWDIPTQKCVFNSDDGDLTP